MLRVDILTLFPKMFSGPFSGSIIKRAQEKGLVNIKIHNLRNWAEDKHKTVDDRPYGGGVGMVFKVEPIYKALRAVRTKNKEQRTKVILLDPGGKKYEQKIARRYSKLDHLILICGHYEGVDQRVKDYLVDEEISIGDYILTGGELPAMVVVDSVVRLLPGVLKKTNAIKNDSFSNLTAKSYKLKAILEYPQYTRPENFKGWKVPKVLLSGNHKEIGKWKKEKSLERTKTNRPDLL